jgi:hypothetical protein
MSDVLQERTLSNRELIERFEADMLDSFHHADHVRLAFAYLSEFPVLQALERFSTGLQRYAAARGKSQLYHETITYAYFFLMRERMARSADADWDEFARVNPDLLVWKNGILARYYREETLQSDLARRVFLLPDKCGCAGIGAVRQRKRAKRAMVASQKRDASRGSPRSFAAQKSLAQDDNVDCNNWPT